MTIFSLYLPILLSLSLSFLLHVFKMHVHSFFLLLVTTFKNNIINTASMPPPSSLASPPIIITHTNDSPPSSTKVANEETNDDGVNNLMCCTMSLGFETINELGVTDQIDNNETDHGVIDCPDCDNENNRNNNEDDKEEEEENEDRRDMGNSKHVFPPPISSLNQKGQPNSVLVPVRMNGRLQLKEVRVKRPEILHASREGGRLRMYLVPNHCHDVEEENYEGEEQEQELTEDEEEEEEERVVESELFEEEEEEDGTVGVLRYGLGGRNIEGLRKCHQVVNQFHHQYSHGGHHLHQHHHHHYNHMYGLIGIS